jgi:anti-sigma B factor antagonist
MSGSKSNSEANGSYYLEVHEAASAGQHTLSPVGELDMASAPELRAAIERACAASPSAITLDLSRLTFIDSTGLHVIASTSERCKGLAIDFQLVPGPQPVQRLFEVTGLLAALPFRAAA